MTRPRQLDGRIPELDGLRGVAILLVFAAHMNFLKTTGFFPADAVIRLGRLGWTGVDLFFVLSGFLITGILLRTKHQPGYFLNFYGRRTLRIVPLYYFLIFFFFAFLPWFPPTAEIGRFLWKDGEENWWYFPLFLANFSEGLGYTAHKGLHVAWSLAVEEQFYLVWPLFVLRYSTKRLIQICIGLVIFTPVLRWFLLEPFGGNRTLIGYMAPCRMDSLAIGGLVAALLHLDPHHAPAVHRWARRLLPVFLAGVPVIIWRQETQTVVDGIYRGQDIGVMTWGYSWMAGLFCCLLVLCLFSPETGWYARAMRSRILRFFGKYSYALYLIHNPVYHAAGYILVTSGLFTAEQATLRSTVQVVMTLAITIPAAMLTWVLIEKPGLRMKRFFEYGGRPGRDDTGQPHPVPELVAARGK